MATVALTDNNDTHVATNATNTTMYEQPQPLQCMMYKWQCTTGRWKGWDDDNEQGSRCVCVSSPGMFIYLFNLLFSISTNNYLQCTTPTKQEQEQQWWHTTTPPTPLPLPPPSTPSTTNRQPTMPLPPPLHGHPPYRHFLTDDRPPLTSTFHSSTDSQGIPGINRNWLVRSF